MEWVAVENLRSAELHCQYRARFLSSLLPRSFRPGSLALFIFLSRALCGMKLSLLVAGVTRCVGVPGARYERKHRGTGERPHARIYVYIYRGRGEGDECSVSLALPSMPRRGGGRVCGVATVKTRPTHPSCRDSVGLLAPRYMDEFGQALYRCLLLPV